MFQRLFNVMIICLLFANYSPTWASKKLNDENILGTQNDFPSIFGPKHEFKAFIPEIEALKIEYPKLYTELQIIRNSIQTSEELHQKALRITQEIIEKEPLMIDAYWMNAGYHMAFGEWYYRHEQKDHALEAFTKSEATATRCLEKVKDQAICLFLQVGASARIAALKGIFSSLSKGKQIQDTLQRIIKMDINYRFQSHNPRSLQGAAHHGLGIFYRVVPDSWLLNFVFGFRGNLEKSEIHHRRSIELDGPVSAYQTELALTLLCQNEQKKEAQKYREAMENLDRVSRLKGNIPMDQFYSQVAQKILEKPETACHFVFGKPGPKLNNSEIKKQVLVK